MFAFGNTLKETVILTSTVPVTPYYTLEVYVHLFHKDAQSFKNLIINIHSVSPLQKGEGDPNFENNKEGGT